MTPEKVNHLKALANELGVIAAVAMDQRGNLRRALVRERGDDGKDSAYEMLSEFKTAVSRILTPHASAILLDPDFGMEAAKARSPGTGLLLAYETSGYDNTQPGRLPELLPHVSVRRLKELGADAIKVGIYYTPFEKPEINDIKHAFVERIGAECTTHGVPFFLQSVGYDPEGGNVRGFQYARQKPAIVLRSMEEFSKPHYGVDVMKVEIPVNTEYVGGSAVYKGQQAYSRAEALEHFRNSASASKKPFIYLSAGVSNTQFVESLQMAAEARVDYSGVLCGRATWKDGVTAYAKHGMKSLEDWLSTDGVKNISAINDAIKAAKPWYGKSVIEEP